MLATTVFAKTGVCVLMLMSILSIVHATITDHLSGNLYIGLSLFNG